MSEFEKFRSILSSKTAKDVIGKDFKLIDIKSDETILTALKRLISSNVSSLPVYNSTVKKYVSCIDIHDIAIVIFVLAVAKSFTDIFSQQVAQWHEFESEDFQFFAKEDVEKFCNASQRNQWKTVSENTPIVEVMKILSNPAQYTELQGKPNVRRVGVISEEGKLIGMISQFGMIDFLTKIIKDSSFFVKVKMSELPLVKEQATIYTINEKELAIEGFKMMLDKSISGLGVVDDKGHLTCVFSSCDIKRENSNQELFIDLRETVKDYLSKSTMYCKKIEVQSFQTRSNDSFVNVLEKIIINHLHQIFELDENNTPIKEYSLCDLIRIFL